MGADIYMATMVADADRSQFEVSVGCIGWSPEVLGSVPNAADMFDLADVLLDRVYGWRRVGGEAWASVPGSDDTVFAVMVEQ